MQKPYYQFNRDEEYYKKMMTSYNNVVYYVGDSFLKKYPTSEEVKNVYIDFDNSSQNQIQRKTSYRFLDSSVVIQLDIKMNQK